MSIRHTVLTASAVSILLGSLGLTVTSLTRPAQADLLAQNSRPAETYRQNRPAGPRHGDRLAAVAEQLGVTEAALKAALGLPAERPEPDFAGAAAQLGTTETELRDALRTSRQGEGRRGGRPDFEAVAAEYGVTVEELAAALGVPSERPQPNFANAAAQLGISEDELRAAFDSVRPNRNCIPQN